ncbi:ABC transporter permease [bacterium]|nr:ABC transporter permease [bacterium]
MGVWAKARAGWERWGWIVPAVILAVLVLIAIAAPLIAPFNVYKLEQIRLEDSALPPSNHYLLGTDVQGRDILSAVMFGLRVSLLVGVCGTILAALAGVALGLAAGWRGGWTESVVMRAADVQLAFPSILIALFMMAIWGSGLMKIIVAVAIAHWVIYARMTRAAVLTEREKEYVAAAVSLGARPSRVVLRHILPNIMAPVVVISAIQFASIVMLEATLSFLGLGVPITRPSLGMLIKFGFNEFSSGAWWIWLFPGLTLMVLIFSLNWLADRMRDREIV